MVQPVADACCGVSRAFWWTIEGSLDMSAA
jgi:hypothetical protein